MKEKQRDRERQKSKNGQGRAKGETTKQKVHPLIQSSRTCPSNPFAIVHTNANTNNMHTYHIHIYTYTNTGTHRARSGGGGLALTINYSSSSYAAVICSWHLHYPLLPFWYPRQTTDGNVVKELESIVCKKKK